MTTNTNLTYTWTSGSDVGAGITNYEIFITNTTASGWYTNISTTNMNINLTAQAEGIYNWYVIDYDYADNYAISVTNTFSIDTSAPTSPTLVSPTNNTLTNNNNIEFIWQSATDAISGISNYRLHITNITSLWGTNVLTGQLTNLVSNLDEGTSFWYVQAQDSAGLWSPGGSSTNMLIIDMTPPIISLISPLSNSASGSINVAFTWQGLDPGGSGITNYKLHITNYAGSGWGTNITTDQTNYAVTSMSIGTNYWQIWAQDKAGNTNYSGIWTVIVDTNIPVATLWAPLNVYTNINTPEFIWSDVSALSSTSNIIQISLTNDFSALARSNAGGAAFTNWSVTPGLATAQYYWRVLTYKMSTATWYTSSVAWVWVDTNAPTAVTLILPADNSITTNTSLTYTWTSGSDIGIGITNYEIFITNTTTSGWYTNISTTNTNINLTAQAEGIYNWYVIDYDYAGNYAISLTNIFTIDTSAPTNVTLISPSDNTFTNSNNIEFIWKSVTDAISGISNYRLHITNITTLWGTNVLTGQLTNLINSLDEGTNYWYVAAQDNAGNWGEWSSTNALIIDLTAPSKVTLISPANNTLTNNNNIEFIWQSVTDLLSGISNYRLHVTNTTSMWGTNVMTDQLANLVSNLDEGTNLWNVQARDRAGNTGDWSITNTLIIDITSPLITLVSPTSNYTSSITSMTLTWQGSDPGGSGISNYRLLITNYNTPWGTNITTVQTNYFIPNMPIGTNYWQVLAQDRAGNTNNSGIWTVIVDVSIPVTVLHSPINIYTNGNVPEFIWSDTSALGSTSNIIQISTTNDFSTLASSNAGGASFTNWAVTPGLATAKYFWRVLTYKLSTTTWYTSSMAWVWVDTNSPEPVDLALPTSNTITTSTNLTYTWTSGSDIGLGITNYEIFITNTSPSGSGWYTNISTTNTNISLTGLAEGIYEWYVIDYDYADNYAISLTNTFIIDTTPPTIVTLISPTNNTLTNSNSIEFIWQTSVDAISGISNYRVYITNANAAWGTNVLTSQLTNMVSNIREGTNLWYVSAQNRAGLLSPGGSSTNAFIIDLTPPAITLQLPSSNSTLQSVDVIFQWNASDPGGSGIANQRIDIDLGNNGSYDISVLANSPYTNTFAGNSTNAWRVWAMDRAGNTNYSTIWTVVIDTNTPIATLYSPINMYTNLAAPTFIWSDESSSGSTSNIIQISTASDFSAIVRTSSGGPAYTNWVVASGLTTAQYYWRVLTYKMSTSTWYTSTPAWVYIDINIPTPVDLLLPSSNLLTTNTSLTYTWTSGSDPGGSGITNYEIFITNTTASGWYTNISTTNTNINLAGLGEGIYEWYVTDYDYADNYAVSLTNTYIIDTSPPTSVTLISPTNNTLTNSNSIEFIWQTSIDTISGVSNYSIWITNAASAWGTNVNTDQLTNLIGNIREGTNLWYVSAQNRVGLWSGYSSTNALIIDLTPPTITLQLPSSNSASGNLNVTFTWTVNDPGGSGIINQRIEIDTNNNGVFDVLIATNSPFVYTFAGNGTNNWRIWAMDRAGNTNYSSIRPIIIYTNKPVVILHSPVGIYTNIDNPRFIWSDVSMMGVTSNVIQISTTNDFSLLMRTNAGGANFTNWPVNPGLSTGLYYWRIVTYRLSTTTWFTSGMAWVFVDTNAPTQVSLLQPITNSLTTNIALNYTWTSGTDPGPGGSGITNYSLIIINSNTGWNTNIVITGTNINVTNQGEGVYNWYVINYDRADNYTISATNIFRIDINPPGKVILISPANNTLTNTNNIEFVWRNSSDAISGITNYMLKVTNITTAWSTNITIDQTNYIINNLTDGSNYWYARAQDRAGHWGGWSVTNLLMIDTTPPLPVTLISPTNILNTTLTSLDFFWNSTTDALSGVANYEIQISTNGFANIWTTNILLGTNITIAGLNLGTNWWRVRAVDNSGNWGEWSSTNRYYIQPELAYFKISHQVNYDLNAWGPLAISAIATNGNGTEVIFKGYTGTNTITVSTNGPAIDWANISGAGSFTQYADGSAEYAFNTADAGVVSLNIQSSLAGAVTVHVYDGIKKDDNKAGPLYFMLKEPFIVSIEPHNQNNYATVSELTNFTITFSRILKTTGTNSILSAANLRFTGEETTFSFSLTLETNTNICGTIGTIVHVHAGLSQQDDILEKFWLIVERSIQSTNGYYMTNNPFNSEYSFGSDGEYRESFITLVDKTIGGTVKFDEARGSLVIGKNVLPDDAYIKPDNPDPSDNKLIADANAKLRGNQFVTVIENDNTYIEILANDRNNEDIVGLNGEAQIYISYKDNDNNGIVDGTDIQESKLKLFRLNEATGEWEVVDGSQVDTVNNKVYANIDKFGTYCIMAYYETDSIISYPNPANINEYDVIIRFNLERDIKVTIKIYTITGELVRNLTEDETLLAGLDRRIHWDGKNDLGLIVVNGVYLIRINRENIDGSGKETIILKQGVIK